MGAVPLFREFFTRQVTGHDIHACLAAAYEGEPFISVAPYETVERSPAINPEALNNTNHMRLHVFANDAAGQTLLMAIYDNLGKGASGAAVQNLNIMTGAAETLGTDLPEAA